MKKLLILAGMLWSAAASAQFVPGQVLTAAELNSQFALYAPLTGATFTGPISGTSATFGNLTATSTVTFPVSSIPFTSLGAQPSNTVLANATAASASPTAFPVPSCSTSSSALNWLANTGLTCNTSVNAATLGGATFASPGPIGSVTPNNGTFTALVSNTLHSTNTAAGASIVVLTGNGATTPNKFLGVLNGNFTIYNSSGSTQLMGMDDSGDVAFAGSLTTSQTAGIVGTTTNNNASIGAVGEYQTVTGTATAITSGVTGNTTSITLTPGDWDVESTIIYNPTATVAYGYVGISATSATFAGIGTYTTAAGPAVTANLLVLASPVTRFSLAVSATIYAVGLVNFASGTCTAQGFIRARRVR